jgi:hypothetical protein
MRKPDMSNLQIGKFLQVVSSTGRFAENQNFRSLRGYLVVKRPGDGCDTCHLSSLVSEIGRRPARVFRTCPLLTVQTTRRPPPRAICLHEALRQLQDRPTFRRVPSSGQRAPDLVQDLPPEVRPGLPPSHAGDTAGAEAPTAPKNRSVVPRAEIRDAVCGLRRQVSSRGDGLGSSSGTRESGRCQFARQSPQSRLDPRRDR